MHAEAHPLSITPRYRRRSVAITAIVGLTATVLVGVAPGAASAAVGTSPRVVISEVYGGGGNSGAPVNQDFVELYNQTDAPVVLDGWSVQYASAMGGTWAATPLAGTIPSGGHFLVGLAFGADLTLPAIAADVTGTSAMSATAGKIALSSTTTALTGATGVATQEAVVDLVGYGANATDFAGTGRAPGTNNAQSVSRNAQNANTADNAADFALATPTPTASGTLPEEPEEPEEPEAPTPATIAEIQGTADVSPLAGTRVLTSGVVTASYPTGGLDGYVIQTPGTGGALDASHTASDALFVYSPATAATVPLGAYVEVAGEVGEYFGLTQITVASASDVAVLSETPAAPAPATVAWPATDQAREVLESMLIAPAGPYTVTNTYTTNQYGEVGLAAGENPLRQPTDVAAPGSAEAAAVAADNAARAVTLDDGATINFLSAANTGLTPAYVSLTEPIVVGAAATFTAPLVVDFRNDVWKLNPTSALVADGSGADAVIFANPRTTAPEPVGGDLSVASFNVLNYFTTLGVDGAACRAFTDRFGDGVTVRDGCDQRGAWDAADLERQQAKIVEAINALDADVVGLMEIENSARLGEQADEAVATLVAALNADAGEDRWAYVSSPADLPETSLQDVITNAMIYQPAAVSPLGASTALGTLSAGTAAFANAREPIAQAFTPVGGGEDFVVVVNHFKSKSSGTLPGDADAGDGQGASNASRVAQATALRDWIATDPTGAGTDSVLLVGDFNAYGQEDPLRLLYAAGYVDAELAFGLDESSYSFGGQSGSLDHVLLSEAAAARATGADIWGINSGEALALEYSRYQYHGTPFYAPDPYRSSDHDPVLVGMTADAPPIELTLLGINDFHGRIDANTVKFAGTIEQLRAEASGPNLLLAAGDSIGASLFPSSVAQDQPTIDVLNALELDATAVGNHEFDRGWADLIGRVSDEADYPQLGANVYLAGTDTPALPEYELFEVDGMTVGVIGAVTEETPSLVSPGGITELDFGDAVDAVNRVAGELSDGEAGNGEADVLVALYHEGAGSGTLDGATLEEEVAAGGPFARIVNETSPEVDAMFTGHTHKQYAWSAPVPGTDRTRPIVQTGSYGAFVGEIVLTIDPETFDVTAHTERNVPRVTTDDAALAAAYPRVAAVRAIVTAALAAAAEVGNTAVAEVAGDITTAFSGGSFVNGVWTGGARDDRASESTLGNLVANAIRDTLDDLPDGALIGVTNPGGLRADLWDTQAEFGATAVPGLPDGTISFSQANAVLPFNNTMALVTLTGAQFTTLLEQQWQRDAAGNVPQRPYLQLGLSDNVTYTFDPALPEGSRITSVTVDGQPLDPAAEYRIGTLSFLATGGDNFRVFTQGTDYVDTGLLDYEAWVDYLADGSPVSPSFAKLAVQVSGVPETVAAGDTVEFAVAGLNLTSRGAPENTTLTVSLDGVELGEVPVIAGAATVSVTLPGDLEPGATALTLVAAPSGTTVTVPLTVERSAVVSETTLQLARTSGAFGDERTVRATANVVSEGEVQGGTVEFLVGDEVIATAQVNGDGVARADLALPGALGVGAYDVVARFVGTADVGPSASAPVVFTVTQARTITSLVAFLPVHINGLLPSTLIALVDQRTGGAPEGVVEFREGGPTGTLIATAAVRGGIATYTLGRISRGTHQYTAVFVPADPDDVAGSRSGCTTVLALF